MNEWLESEKSIDATFSQLVPGEHPNSFILKKIFLSKTKILSKDDGINHIERLGGDDQLSDSFDEEDSDSDEEEFDLSLPTNCEKNLYLSVLELREKRLRQEHTLTRFRKQLEDLKRANDRYSLKEDTIEKELKINKLNLQKLYCEKQQYMNELLTTIVVKACDINLRVSSRIRDHSHYKPLSDIYHDKARDNDALILNLACQNLDFKVGVVFERTKFESLKTRIFDICCETKNDRNALVSLKKEKMYLDKKKKNKEKDIQYREKMCEELQHLRFGQLLNIEALDEVVATPSKRTEIENKNESLGARHEKESKDILRLLMKLKIHLYNETRSNTTLLKRLRLIGERQMYLDRARIEMKDSQPGTICCTQANNGNKIVTTYDKIDEEELKMLRKLAQDQAKELLRLKGEISALGRKGGKRFCPYQNVLLLREKRIVTK